MIISGKYEVKEKVGQGGMGIVYRVCHTDLDTILALKILPRDLSNDDELVERFQREARVMARLNHRNIVKVFDFAKDGDTYYLIMEFLQGKNLHELLTAHMKANQAPLPLAEVLRIGEQIAEALAYAHGQPNPVVHRDIKPRNIIVEDTTGRAVVTDFGIAKLMGEQSQSDLTRSGVFVGTPKYCAPEQLRHDEDLDERVDIYSLGMVLYELYTGRQYFAGLKDHEVIGRVLYQPGENTVSLPDAPPQFTQIVERAIARERSVRYAHASALLEDLHACLNAIDRDVAESARGAAAEDAPTEEVGSIEAQIRALERKRLHRLASQAREECRTAREEAEEAGAERDTPTEFGRAQALERDAEDRLVHNDNRRASELFRDAATVYKETLAQVAARRRHRDLDQARATARALAAQGVERGVPALAPEQWSQAEQVARTAAETADAGDHDRAIARFAEAAEAYGTALRAAQRTEDLRAIEAELPGVRAARADAERAAAADLAADLFTAAMRDEHRLDEALGEGQLTVARELLPKVREEFRAAAVQAVDAGARRDCAEARERATAAAASARDGRSEELAPDETAAARGRERDAESASDRGDWDRARELFLATAELYDAARIAARTRRDLEDARRAAGDAARATAAARDAAEQAGANDAAADAMRQANAIAARADEAAGGGDFAAATSAYRDAEDRYADAARLAELHLERTALEARLAEVAAARAEVIGLGGEATPALAAARKAEDESRRALAGGDLGGAAAAAAEALSHYRRARADAQLRRHLDDVDRALEAVQARRAEAVEIGADSRAAEDYAKAERLRAEVEAKRASRDWEAATALAGSAEKGFAASIKRATDAIRSELNDAKSVAAQAGARRDELGDADRREREGVKHLAAGATVLAARAFRDACDRYRAALAPLERAATEAEQAARAARRNAEEADAGRLCPDAFRGADEALQRAVGEQERRHYRKAARGFTECAKLFADAARSAERARAQERATAARAKALEARAAAERAGASELVGGELGAAAESFAEAERTLAAGSDVAAAEAAFTALAATFGRIRAAAETAFKERARVASVRADAERAQATLRQGGAADLAPRDVEAAERVFAEADRAFAAGDLRAAESGFRAAVAAFADAAAAAGRIAALRDEAADRRRQAEEARAAAEAIGAGELAPAKLASGGKAFAGAARAFDERDFRGAASAFEAARAAFADARADSEHVAAERGRAASAREEAQAARAKAETLRAADLLPTELRAAIATFEKADAAVAAKDFTAAADRFRAAAVAFAEISAGCERLVAEREAQAAAARAQQLWVTRDPSREGPSLYRVRARWTMRQAQNVLQRGARKIESGDFAAARADYENAARLLESIPVTPARIARAEDETRLAPAGGPATPSAWSTRRIVIGSGLVVLAIALPLAWRRMPFRSEQTTGASADKTSAKAAASTDKADDRVASAPAEPRNPVAVPRREEAAPAATRAPAAAPLPAATVVVPPPEPPRLARVEPDEANVQLGADDKSASFAVQLADASGASYRWKVDDKVVSDGETPGITVPAGDQRKVVEVIATTPGGEVRRRWELAALPRATAVPPPVAPLLAMVPSDPSFEVAIGKSTQLRVKATDPTGSRLSYAWTVDGGPVGRDTPSFKFAPRAKDEGESRRVKVEVTNAGKQSATAEWTIKVPTEPVQIVRRSPRDDLRTTIGERKELSVEARAGGEGDAPLSYSWSVNGEPVRDASGPRYAYDADRESADVEVVVSSPGRAPARSGWRIAAVRPAPPPAPPPARTPAAPARNATNATAEVRQWIDAYRAAYENKNIDRLIALGVVSPAQADRLRRALDDLPGLEVTIESPSVSVQGDAATVAFTRIDRFRVGSRYEEKTITINKTLRRRGGAWVAD